MVDHLDPSLTARLTAVPLFADRTDVTELSGGLTNRNLKVTTPAGVFVARLSSPESALLSIDRVAEQANSVAAAESGAAPEVVAYAPEINLLAVRFVEGRTWTSADVLVPENAARIAAACRQLHAGPRFVNDFNMLTLQPKYLALVQEREFRLPDRYLDFADQAKEISDALSARPVATVPCNNDLRCIGTLALRHSSDTWPIRLAASAGKVRSYWRHSVPSVPFQSMFAWMP